jgi:hypothetical protein
MTIGPLPHDKHHTGDEPAEFIETPTFAPSAYPHVEPEQLLDRSDQATAP